MYISKKIYDNYKGKYWVNIFECIMIHLFKKYFLFRMNSVYKMNNCN